MISRKDDIILNPVDSVVFPEEEEAVDVSKKKANDSLTELLIQGRSVSAASFQRDFELSDVLDYVRCPHVPKKYLKLPRNMHLELLD